MISPLSQFAGFRRGMPLLSRPGDGLLVGCSFVSVRGDRNGLQHRALAGADQAGLPLRQIILTEFQRRALDVTYPDFRLKLG